MDEMVKATMNAKMKNDRLCNAKALLVSYAGLAGTLALKEQTHKSPASGAWRLEINEVFGSVPSSPRRSLKNLNLGPMK
jgi:hypothetical protein